MAQLDWRELQALNNQRQTGEPVEDEQDWLAGWSPDMPNAQDEYARRYHDRYIGNRMSGDEQLQFLGALNDRNFRPEYTQEDVINSGYGESKFDYKVPFDQWIKDPVNSRSNAQRGIGQIANGLAKMGFYGLATFADNTAGLVNGIGNIVKDAVDGDGFHPTESFINNWTSERLNSLREWSDRVFPNYRTREEQEDQDHWWRHMNANFWGDTFLKNLGFTIGAGFSGAAYSRLLQASKGRLITKAYKAALAAAEGDAEAEAAFREVLQGGKAMSPEKIYDVFAKTKKSFERMKWESQLIGSVGGAMGESRMEAMQAAKEFRDQQLLDYQQDYNMAKAELQDEVMHNPDFLTEEPVYDGYGNVVDTRPALNAAGQEYYRQRIEQLQNDYNEKRQVIDNEATRLANWTFWPNMLVLTGSNAVMFGRIFAGGFNTQAKAKVRGRFGNYTGKGSVLGTAGRGLVTATTEGMEELTQKMISESTKDIASQNVASFHNSKYDQNAIKDVTSGILSVMNSVGNVVGDNTSWEEFAIGFLTGGLAETVTGGFKNSERERKTSQDFADKLNERIGQESFKTLWEGLVRHKHYENIKDILLDSKVNGQGEEIKDRHGNPVGTQFAWQTANDAQILSDVMMFADAGRLDDLEAYVDSFARISEDDMPHLSTMLSDETIKDFDKKSDAEKVKWVKDRADEVKKAINQYRNFHDSIDYLSFGTSDPEAINELIYTQAQLQNFENRYNNLLDQVINEVRPTIEQVAKEVKADGTPTADARQAMHLLESESDMRRLFGGWALDTRGLSQDTPSPLGDYAVMRDDVRQSNVMKGLEAWGTFTDNPETKQKVADLQSLVRARQDFYARLFSPQFRKNFAERYEEKAESPAAAVTEIEDESRQKTVDGYIEKLDAANTFGEYLQIYRDQIPNLDRATQKMLDSAVENNQKLKAFEGKIADAEAFYANLRNKVTAQFNNNTDPKLIQPLDKLSDVVADFDLDSFLISLPEGADANLEMSRLILDQVSDDPETAALALNVLREQLGDEKQAAALGTISPNPSTGGKEKTAAPYIQLFRNTNNENDGDVVPVSDTTEAKRRRLSIQQAADKAVDDADFLSRIQGSGMKFAFNDVASGRVKQLFDQYKNGEITADEFLNNFVPEEFRTKPDSGTVATGGSSTVAQFKLISDLIGGKVNPEDDVLVALANGDFSQYPGLSENDQLRLSALATAKIQELSARKGGVATRDEIEIPAEKPKDELQSTRTRQVDIEMRTSALPLDPFSFYVPADLQKGIVRRYTDRKGTGVQETLNWMHDHRVQEFIDSGALARMEEDYRNRNEGKPMPVYFIGNPHYLPNNKQNNPFAGPYKGSKYSSTTEVLMAVEMTPESREALKAFEEAKVFEDSTLITIDGKQYQVIGEMWNLPITEKNGVIKAGNREITQEEKPLYESMKEQARRVWEYAIGGSVLPQYQAEIKKSGTGPFPTEGKWYVAKTHPKADTEEMDTHQPDWTTGDRLYTTLNYMMSGRNETRTVGQESPSEVPLRNSLHDYESVGGEYHFALITNDIKYTQGSPEFPPSINAPRGSLWMATRAANGAWEWTPVTVARTYEYDFNANVNTPLVQRMQKDLEVLFAPSDPTAGEAEHKEDFQKRFDAQRDLQSILYLGRGNSIYLAFEEEHPVVYVGGYRCDDVKDFFRHLSSKNASEKDPSIGYRFQVSQEALDDPDMMMDLVDAGVLLSQMRSFIRRGTSIGVNFLEDRNEDNELVTPYPRSTNNELARTPGSITNTTWDTEGFSTTDPTQGVVQNVRIGDAGYQLHADGSVYRRDSRNRTGDKVDNDTIVAQVKALAELIGGTPAHYGGKAWVIDTKAKNKSGKETSIQYTELFERVVDGITVHMIRRGKNGAILLAYGDSEWNALMQAKDLKPLNANYSRPEQSEESKQAEAEAEFNQIRAAELRENGGQPNVPSEAPTEQPEPARRRRKRSMPTVQEAQKEEEKEQEERDCEGGGYDID